MVDTSKALKQGCYTTREFGSKLWTTFKYERLSDFCYSCGHLDHSKPACPLRTQQSTKNQFGPWLRASFTGRTGKQNRNGKKNNNRGETPAGQVALGVVPHHLNRKTLTSLNVPATDPILGSTVSPTHKSSELASIWQVPRKLLKEPPPKLAQITTPFNHIRHFSPK